MDTTQKTITKRTGPYEPKPPKPSAKTQARFNPKGWCSGGLMADQKPPATTSGPRTSWAPEERPNDCPKRAAFIDSIVSRRRP